MSSAGGCHATGEPAKELTGKPAAALFECALDDLDGVCGELRPLRVQLHEEEIFRRQRPGCAAGQSNLSRSRQTVDH